MCEACVQSDTFDRATALREIRRRTGWSVPETSTTFDGMPTSDGPLVRFAFFDPEGIVETVRLRHGLAGHRNPPSFQKHDAELFTLEFEAGDAWRVEYRLEISDAAGNTRLIHDPLNPCMSDDPFGGKSIVLREGASDALYLTEPAAQHRSHLRVERVALPCVLGGASEREVAVWQPPAAGDDDELPLIIFLDGSDYVRYARGSTMLENLVGWGRLRPCRAVFVPPVKRDEEYSAHPAMPAWFDALLSALGQTVPIPRHREQRLAVGTSLGALCLLHTAAHNPQAFGGLVLQSGSYFQPATDSMESSFPWFNRIVGAVTHILERGVSAQPLRIAATCGSAGENIRNNDRMMESLARQGVESVSYQRVRDAHNWTAWRNCVGDALMTLLPGPACPPARA